MNKEATELVRIAEEIDPAAAQAALNRRLSELVTVYGITEKALHTAALELAKLKVHMAETTRNPEKYGLADVTAMRGEVLRCAYDVDDHLHAARMMVESIKGAKESLQSFIKE